MADRPIECTECKRPTCVDYTEIAGGQYIELSMCAECPVWHRKMYGSEGEMEREAEEPTGICCGNCNTSLEEVRMGHPLGCSECYEVFTDVINADLITSGRLSQKIGPRPVKGTPLHVGRSPGERVEMSPAIELVALNEALAETLSIEDYEQAAWLRDQIQRLQGRIDDRS
jgi:protein arginine kinase activator